MIQLRPMKSLPVPCAIHIVLYAGIQARASYNDAGIGFDSMKTRSVP